MGGRSTSVALPLWALGSIGNPKPPTQLQVLKEFEVLFQPEIIRIGVYGNMFGPRMGRQSLF